MNKFVVLKGSHLGKEIDFVKESKFYHEGVWVVKHANETYLCVDKEYTSFYDDDIKAYEIAVGALKNYGEISVYVEDGNEDYEYRIESAENFCGGEEGYYMCSELGNIQYDDEESIVSDLFEMISRNNEKILSVEE